MEFDTFKAHICFTAASPAFGLSNETLSINKLCRQIWLSFVASNIHEGIKYFKYENYNGVSLWHRLVQCLQHSNNRDDCPRIGALKRILVLAHHGMFIVISFEKHGCSQLHKVTTLLALSCYVKPKLFTNTTFTHF